MKKLLFLLFAATTSACGYAPQTAPTGEAVKTTASEVSPISDNYTPAAESANRVDVICFHTKQRCPTCIAIERLTQEVVETHFAEQLLNGTLTLRKIDITLPKNEPLADRYEVTWSSLLINKWDAGNESVNNLTKFAFANARTNPDKFRDEVTRTINELLVI